jgi:SAM-dependent methyltransferase
MCADWNQLFTDPTKIIRKPDPLVEEICRILPSGARVLDLGCGAGRHLLSLAQGGFRVFGSDLSPEGLRLSKQWLNRDGFEAPVLLAEMTRLPFMSLSFDGAISINVLNHGTLAEGVLAVKEIHRSLKDKAPFFFLIIGRDDFRCGEGDQIEHFTFVHRQGIEAGVAHHFYTQGEIQQLVSGFSRIQIKDRRRPYDPHDPIWGNDPRAVRRVNAFHQHWEVRVWK